MLFHHVDSNIYLLSVSLLVTTLVSQKVYFYCILWTFFFLKGLILVAVQICIDLTTEKEAKNRHLFKNRLIHNISSVCNEGISVISWEKKSLKSVSSSQMALWLPPHSLTPSTSLHLLTLLFCSISNVTLFYTQGWEPGRSADSDLAKWDICFIIDLFNPKPLIWKCARLPQISSFWRRLASSFQ